ncbi:unnamed protein product [Pseudo-nitzschia multistriata]|uniref:Uncharacterized protein n=1 Tax=Pseudo-nitzschia multistriata TaxID=183589 RepID=A0A448YZ50_9STRA|nr:unnamed protein product [Pseudo-nitzschia multistriata]
MTLAPAAVCPAGTLVVVLGAGGRFTPATFFPSADLEELRDREADIFDFVSCGTDVEFFPAVAVGLAELDIDDGNSIAAALNAEILDL